MSLDAFKPASSLRPHCFHLSEDFPVGFILMYVSIVSLRIAPRIDFYNHLANTCSHVPQQVGGCPAS